MSGSFKKILKFIGSCIVVAGIAFLIFKAENLIGYGIEWLLNLKGESGTYAIIPVASYCCALVFAKRVLNDSDKIFPCFVLIALPVEILTFALGNIFGVVVFMAVTLLSFLVIVLSGIMWIVIPIYRFFK